jgi:hypothetical protein
MLLKSGIIQSLYNTIVWSLTPHSLVQVYLRFGAIRCFHLQEYSDNPIRQHSRICTFRFLPGISLRPRIKLWANTYQNRRSHVPEYSNACSVADCSTDWMLIPTLTCCMRATCCCIRSVTSVCLVTLASRHYSALHPNHWH